MTGPRPELGVFLDEARTLIDGALDRLLPTPPDCPPLLAEAMRYSLCAGGKRLRPVLTLAAADAVARRTGVEALDLALPAACAVELIHTFSLIHDDLPAMDNDSLRRGRPTLHTVYGDGVAILAGDALQAEAFSLIAREPVTADPAIVSRKLTAVGVLAVAAGAVGMVGGQTVDLQAAGQVAGHPLTLTPDSLRAMHLQKTGALVRASAVCGAVMAGGDARLVSAVSQWATEVGLAFQIVDDILDVEGDAAALGKTPGKDAAGAKPTYTSLFGVEEARAMAAQCRSRAHACLVGAGLMDSWLDDIAAWVIARRH
ncbi:MAG: polyprenyl synthetase family protein [Vicinamibacterales bacterium]